MLKRLGATEVVIALLPTMQMAFTGITQLPATARTRRLRRKVPISTVLFGIAPLGWVGMGVAAGTLGPDRPELAVVGVLVCGALGNLFMGAANPVWSDITARLYPENRRGLAAAVLWGVMGLFGVLAGLYARHVLAEVPYPYNFARLLIIAGILASVGSQFLWFAREYVPNAQTPQTGPGSYVGLLKERWQSDARLRRFVGARALYDIGAPVSVFYAVHAIDRLALTDVSAGTFTLVISGAGILGGLFLGTLGDRRGYRRVVGWGMILLLAATILAILADSMGLFMLVFLLQGMAQTGIYMGTMNFLIEATKDKSDCATPMAMFSTMMLPVWMVAPLVMGLLAERISMPTALCAGGLAQLLGWVALISFVDDPRRPGQRVLSWPATGLRSLFRPGG